MKLYEKQTNGRYRDLGKVISLRWSPGPQGTFVTVHTADYRVNGTFPDFENRGASLVFGDWVVMDGRGQTFAPPVVESERLPSPVS